MQVLKNGNISVDAADLEALKTKCYVSMSSKDFVNIIGTYMPNGCTIGFRGYIGNLELYVEKERVSIVSEDHLAACFAMIDSIVLFSSFRPE